MTCAAADQCSGIDIEAQLVPRRSPRRGLAGRQKRGMGLPGDYFKIILASGDTLAMRIVHKAMSWNENPIRNSQFEL